jgi:hypothetical protein
LTDDGGRSPRRYNELSTITIKKTSATTQSVANTAKRAIVIVGSAIAFQVRPWAHAAW